MWLHKEIKSSKQRPTLLGAFFLAFVSTQSLAESPTSATDELQYYFQDTQNPVIKSSLETLQKVQIGVGQTVDYLGQKIDRIFGDGEIEPDRKGSELVVFIPTTFYENGRSQTRVNFRAKLDLPRTNRRWKLLVSSFNEPLYEEAEVGSGTNSTNMTMRDLDAVEDDTTTFGLRNYLIKTEKQSSQLDLGLKFTDFIDPNPYIRLKHKFNTSVNDNLSSRTTQNVFWERALGGAWETQQLFDYRLRPKTLLRSQTNGIWWHKDGEYLLNQKGIWFETMNAHRVFAYYVDANWTAINQGIDFNDVSIGVNWRERLYKDWLYTELEPKSTWRKEDNFNSAELSLMFMLEMRFYRPK